MKNSKRLYDDDTLSKLSVLAESWLEGDILSGMHGSEEGKGFDQLLILAADVEKDERLKARLDSETISTLRLIAIMQNGASSFLDKIEMPEEIDEKIISTIHSLAMDENARHHRLFSFRVRRLIGAAAVIALLFAGGYSLLNKGFRATDSESALLTDLTSTKDIECKEDSILGKANHRPKEALIAQSIPTEDIYKKKTRRGIHSMKHHRAYAPSSNASSSIEIEEENLPLERTEQTLMNISELCEDSEEITSDKMKETLGMMAMQTNAMHQAINDNLSNVDNLVRTLQGSFLMTKKSVEQASMPSASVSHITPPREIFIKNKAIPAAPLPTEP